MQVYLQSGRGLFLQTAANADVLKDSPQPSRFPPSFSFLHPGLICFQTQSFIWDFYVGKQKDEDLAHPPMLHASLSESSVP